MKMFKNVLSPEDYLGEKCSEDENGKLKFTTAVIRDFCDTYTSIDYDILTKTDKAILRNKLFSLASLNRFPGTQNTLWDGKKIDI